MASSVDKRPQASRVPSGRINRFLQIGATAGRMAAGGLAESARRIGKKAQAELPHALLTGENARLLAARLARLRGAAMKVGQMLSLEGDSSLPAEFAQALEVLRSSAHHMPRNQVESVLTRELGKGYQQRFAHLELVAMKAASIGQVHRGRTHDGLEIVLKVQYPGVAESIDSDVDNLRSLLSLTRLLPGDMDLDAFILELKDELRREVDYERELEQLALYGERLGNLPGFRVPRGIPELSSQRVLTMEYAPGVELLEWAKDASQSARDRVARQLIRLLLHEFFVLQLMQTDPNPANYLIEAANETLILLDFGATRPVPDHISAVYRKAFQAIAHKDVSLILEVISELGIQYTSGSPALDLVVEIALLSAELFEPGEFDFASSDLAQTLNEKGRQMARYRKDITPPPPEYVFFQRKLGGTFLLCRGLKARVDCRALLSEYGIVE